jgi:hypothetical protein
MLVQVPHMNFSVHQLISQRSKFQHKICYKENIKELRGKTTPTLALASRLFRDGKNLQIYKNCNKFFIEKLLKKIPTLSQNNEFKNLYHQYQSFTDFNRVLF